MLDKEPSNNKKVLITGASGFLGSHVADSLTKSGYEVTVFDCVESPFLQKSQEMVVGSILNYEELNTTVKGCDYVYHFAGIADIGESSKNPEKTISVNIIGTQNVLKASVENKVKRIVFASTIYVYSHLGSFYRVSKQACEKLIEEYAREFSLPYTILRFGSLYGPRANTFNSINNMLKQAMETNKITRRGNGEEIREYIHVKDAAALSVEILADKYENEHLIITGKQSLKIKELLLMIKEILNNKIEINYESGAELHHYEITPFTYRTHVARRLTPESFFDLGQGLVEMLQEIEGTMHNRSNQCIGLRPRK